jgi:hypothetical protein
MARILALPMAGLTGCCAPGQKNQRHGGGQKTLQ